MTYVDGLVSIIMGCYNAEPEHLREALDSALTQTYPHCEVVVVDDGSTSDGTLQVLDEYADRIVLLHQANAGVAAARNTAAARARGEFLQVLDSDDRLGATVAEQGVAVLAGNPKVELAYSPADMFGATTGVIKPPLECQLSDMMQTNVVTGCAMVRHERWDTVGGQAAHLRDGYEDYEFWVRILRDGGIAKRTESARLEYRVRHGSRSDQITDGAATRTREVMIEMNPDHLADLLRAAFVRLDAYDREKRDYRKLDRWYRKLKPVIELRHRLRQRGTNLVHTLKHGKDDVL